MRLACRELTDGSLVASPKEQTISFFSSMSMQVIYYNSLEALGELVSDGECENLSTVFLADDLSDRYLKR